MHLGIFLYSVSQSVATGQNQCVPVGPASMHCPLFHRKGGLHFRCGIIIYFTVGHHFAKCVWFIIIYFVIGEEKFKCVPRLGVVFFNNSNLEGVCDGGAGHKELVTFFARIHGCVAFRSTCQAD